MAARRTIPAAHVGLAVSLLASLAPALHAAPTIHTQPASPTIAYDSHAVLQVSATGSGPLTYQWYAGPSGHTAVPLPAATAPLFVSAALRGGAAVWVRVTDSTGSTDSAASTITVNPASGSFLHTFGRNNSGQLGDGSTADRSTPASTASGVISVAAGESHTLFVKTDGSVWATGANSDGQFGNGSFVSRTTPVQATTGYVAASVGRQHSMFLQADGTLRASGSNDFGQLGTGNTFDSVIPTHVATGVASVSAGGYHTAFAKFDGALWASGNNGYGQLGTGDTTNRSTPAQIATGVVVVSAGGFHTHFVKTDGSLWAMGANSNGQLGDGSTVDRYSPVLVATGVISVSAGATHTMFVKADGTLWGMGSNLGGQLGGNDLNYPSPIQIATGVASVTVGDHTSGHALFVKTDGTVWTMGNSVHGKLGDGFTPGFQNPRPVPLRIAAGGVAVDAGSHHSTLLATSATLAPVITTEVWNGYAAYGATVTRTILATGTLPFTYQWYRGTSGDTTSPIIGANSASYEIAPLTETTQLWVRVSNPAGSQDSATFNTYLFPRILAAPTGTNAAFGGNAALQVSADGGPPLTYQWYRGATGDLSSPVPGATSPLLVTPALYGNASFWVRVSNPGWFADSPAAHVAVTTGPAHPHSFGSNTHGQLGDGSTTGRPAPVPVSSEAVAVAAGADHSLFLKSDATLWAAGSNTWGQLGDGTGTPRETPVQVATDVNSISAGVRFTLFVKNDGTLWAMGMNGHGQLGDGTFTPRSTPVLVATGVAAVSAGGDSVNDSAHAMFVKTDGSLWAMGSNNAGELGGGAVFTNQPWPIAIAGGVKSVSAGRLFTHFVKADGTLWAMGSAFFGQLGNGATSGFFPTPVPVGTNVASVSAGHFHALCVKTDGTLWATGRNSSGQLGDGFTANRALFTQVATGVATATTGNVHSLFVKTDGSLWAMGNNASGQLGDGSTTNRSTPVRIADGVRVADAGDAHSVLLASSVSLAPWIISNSPNATSTYSATPTLSVTAGGLSPLTYQWYRGAAGDTSWPIVGATTNSHTTAPLVGTSDFWARVSNGLGSADTATIVLTVPASSYYAFWAAAAGLTAANSAPLLDPDGDGLANLLECGVDSSPLSGANPAHAAPTATIETISGERVLVLTHRRSKAALVAGITFNYQTSTELTAWSPASVTPVVINPDVDGDNTVELVRVAFPMGTAPRLFARLAVGM